MTPEISELVELAEQGRLGLGDRGPDPQGDDPFVLRGVSLLADALDGVRALLREGETATAMEALHEMSPGATQLLVVVAACELELVGFEVVE